MGRGSPARAGVRGDPPRDQDPRGRAASVPARHSRPGVRAVGEGTRAVSESIRSRQCARAPVPPTVRALSAAPMDLPGPSESEPAFLRAGTDRRGAGPHACPGAASRKRTPRAPRPRAGGRAQPADGSGLARHRAPGPIGDRLARGAGPWRRERLVAPGPGGGHRTEWAREQWGPGGTDARRDRSFARSVRS